MCRKCAACYHKIFVSDLHLVSAHTENSQRMISFHLLCLSDVINRNNNIDKDIEQNQQYKNYRESIYCFYKLRLLPKD